MKNLLTLPIATKISFCARKFPKPFLQEVIFGAAGLMGWLVICGIGASVSQSTILETGEAFGWLSVGGTFARRCCKRLFYNMRSLPRVETPFLVSVIQNRIFNDL